MSKLILWFHCIPDLLQKETADQMLQDITLSAYRVDEKQQQISKLFNGSFKQFLENNNLYKEFKDTIVYLPSKMVLYKQLDVPSRSRNKIKQALPFLLEDYLLEDTEQYFFALGSIKNNHSNVAIIKRPVMDFLWEQFNTSKIPVSYISSEVFLLADDLVQAKGSFPVRGSSRDKGSLAGGSNNWMLRVYEDKYFIHNKELAFAIDKNNIEVFFNKIFKLKITENTSQNDTETTTDNNLIPTENQEKLIIYQSGDDSDSIKLIKSLAEKNHICFEVKQREFISTDGILYRPLKAAGINLLQDKYQTKNYQRGKVPFFKSLLVLALISFLSQTIFMSYQWYSYDKQLIRMKQQLEQEFFSLFPDARRLIDVRVQTQNRLDKLKAGVSQQQSFLNLLSLVAAKLQQFNNVEFINVRYNDRVLIIEFLSREFIFDKLKKQFSTIDNLDITELSSLKDDKGIHSIISFKYDGNS